MQHRVLIVGGARQSKRLAGILKAEGYEEVHLAFDCDKAIETARTLLPEVIVMDASLPCENPVGIARKILDERPVPIIMHSSYSQIEQVMEADEMGISAHLFRPINKENLLGAIELGISRFRQCQALRAEVGDCHEALRIRKLVERAKGILMKRSSLTEEQAFLKLQKLSRDTNVTMEKVAQSIITASELI
jgi:AmiR/NasT family two-component response regulator